ncbi:UvrD-helicase domain-containing protein [Peribacillus sp. TH27]|uniref:UvrD-helicase domain-containing protein n=1 Tax=Peribacillus sp. TH27 TaxID=2798484 RepID=UPI00191339A9|nr:UvrD-helicase domain-containing protein [Peribacillus sp. TH27]MBK5462003.1 UvrD-helicase domain-containing protein [Peribacillus sp. TH27]
MEQVYSELIIAKSRLIDIQDIYRKVMSGTKIIILTNQEVNWPDKENEKLLKKSMMYQVHCDVDFLFEQNYLSYQNGKGFDNIYEELKNYFPTFNAEQYMIEHNTKEESVLVAAGAGSGKTTVMVQRVLFLMKHESVSPEKIAMITFTREAAKNMFEKLSEALFLRFKITQRAEYLRDIEKLNGIQISTIDSFLYKMFRQLGGGHGLSPNVRIRNYKQERKELIEQAVDAFISEYTDKVGESSYFDRLLSNIRDYELIKLIDDFWSEFEKKGVQIQSKEVLDSLFGQVDEVHKPLQDLIVQVLDECEKSFSKIQEDDNAVTLSYMSRIIDQLLKSNSNLFRNISLPHKYLFIDEFQDSSDFQIKLAQMMKQQLNVSLFVVGDIKQSIYRFRGADDNAFNKINPPGSAVEEKVFSKFSLNQNYRSNKDLLSLLDKNYFSNWGSEFKYGENDRLISFKVIEEGAIPLYIKPLNYEEKDECGSTVINWLKTAAKQTQGKEKSKIAVLTRTRREARLVAEWCADEQIPYHLDIGGTLFESEATRDLNRLLHALLYPNDTRYISDYLTTPYSRFYLEPSFLFSADGKKEELLKLLDDYTGQLKEYQREVRRIPVLSLLRIITEETEVVNRYFERQKKQGLSPEDAKRKALSYELNLGRLFDLMVQQHSNDYMSLPSLLSWLNIQLKTNRNEDEAKDEELTKNAVNILTVHRAKGLEYHTVIIPFTDRYFHTTLFKSGVVFNTKKTKAGWKFVVNRSKQANSEKLNYYNNEYGNLDDIERKAITAEELRLLYVAMTRAEQQLWIIKYTAKTKECWAKYLPVYNSPESEKFL